MARIQSAVSHTEYLFNNALRSVLNANILKIGDTVIKEVREVEPRLAHYSDGYLRACLTKSAQSNWGYAGQVQHEHTCHTFRGACCCKANWKQGYVLASTRKIRHPDLIVWDEYESKRAAEEKSQQAKLDANLIDREWDGLVHPFL
jgi:hypothetical protein